MKLIKQITAGLLSALTIVSSCPIAYAGEMGDARPSGAEIKETDTLQIL